MSKNIIIQEGGLAKQLTVDKLKTNLIGSGTCMWVPEDETQLTTKTITENGTYKASDDGYYGYEQVVVNIAGTGTATGTDGDGDEIVAHPTNPDDPENPGPLLTDKVPSRIEVITPPTNPYGIYTNGQTITTDGMVVKAYLKTGGEYGTVPNGEITLNPTTADYDASTDVPGGYSTDGGEIAEQFPAEAARVNFPIQSSGFVSTESDYWDNTFSGEYIFATSVTSSGYTLFACSKTQTTINNAFRAHTQSGTGVWTQDTISLDESVTFNGKTFYVKQISYATGQPNLVYNGPAVVTGDTTFIAYCILFGDTEETRAGSRQQITVSWPRPLDGKVLETTFEILVAPPYSDGSEE